MYMIQKPIKSGKMMKIIIILAALFTMSASAAEKVGNTYSIGESDMLQDVKEVARTTDWNKELSKNVDTWSAFKGVPLPEATEDKVRLFIPWYTTEMNVTDPKTGKVLYPKGFTFNPLIYVYMPFRVLVVSPGQEDWLMDNMRDTDQVVFTTGNVARKSVDLKISDRPLYLLNPPVVERMKLRVTPSIVEQVKAQYRITEVDITKWREKKGK